MTFLTRKEEIEVIEGFSCDRCGTSYYEENFIEMQEMLHYKNVGGYGAMIGDGVEVELTLCQLCANVLLGNYWRIIQ